MEKPQPDIPFKYILAAIVGIIVLILIIQIKDPIFLFLLLLLVFFIWHSGTVPIVSSPIGPKFKMPNWHLDIAQSQLCKYQRVTSLRSQIVTSNCATGGFLFAHNPFHFGTSSKERNWIRFQLVRITYRFSLILWGAKNSPQTKDAETVSFRFWNIICANFAHTTDLLLRSQIATSKGTIGVWPHWYHF